MTLEGVEEETVLLTGDVMAYPSSEIIWPTLYVSRPLP